MLQSLIPTRLDSRYLVDARRGNLVFNMTWLIYVLSSKIAKKSYIGSTNYLDRRIDEHNKGKSYFTKKYKPWEIIYTEEYETEKEARVREKYLKSASGRKKVIKPLFFNHCGIV